MKRPHPENLDISPDDVIEYVRALEETLIAVSGITGFEQRLIPGIDGFQVKQWRCLGCGCGSDAQPIVTPAYADLVRALAEVRARRRGTPTEGGAPCS